MKKNKDLSAYREPDVPSAKEMSFGIVVADWNAEITHALLDGCLETLRKHGVETDNIHTLHVPGSFELTTGAKLILANRKVHSVICLGCVIKGETKHNEYISQAVASGLTHLGVLSGKPVVFGVLTPNNMGQALDRAGGKHGNKGVEAAITAIRMAAIAENLQNQERKIGF